MQFARKHEEKCAATLRQGPLKEAGHVLRFTLCSAMVSRLAANSKIPSRQPGTSAMSLILVVQIASIKRQVCTRGSLPDDYL